MKDNAALTIKVIISGVLGVMGIMYIMAKPPVSEIKGYQKQAMPKPYSYGKSDSRYKAQSSYSTDSDAISLTGKTGRYSEQLIGKRAEPTQK